MRKPKYLLVFSALVAILLTGGASIAYAASTKIINKTIDSSLFSGFLSPISHPIKKIYNIVPVTGIGLDVSKYFYKVLNYNKVINYDNKVSKLNIQHTFVIFVRAALVKRYSDVLSKEIAKGFPVIFVGNISRYIWDIVDVISSSPGMVAIPVKNSGEDWIYGIIKHPDASAPGEPVPTDLFGIGGNKLAEKDKDLGKDIISAYRWAVKNLKYADLSVPYALGLIGQTNIGGNKTPHISEKFTRYQRGLSNNLRKMSKKEPKWKWIGTMKRYINYTPYGQMAIMTRYYWLSNNPNPSHDYFIIRVVHQAVPGSVASIYNSSYDGSWMNYKFSEKLGITYYDKNNSLIDYAPTTSSGVTTITVSLGGGIALSQNDVSSSLTWTFSVSHSEKDVTVEDLSDFAYNTAWWVWKVTEDSPPSRSTIKVEPGALISTLKYGGPSMRTGWLEDYKVQFIKKDYWFFGWHYSYSPLYDYGYGMLMIWRCGGFYEKISDCPTPFLNYPYICCFLSKFYKG